MYDDDLIRPWFDHALGSVPGAELFDLHVHIGQNDPDGYTLSPAELVAELEGVGARGAVFPMQEPAGYRSANDRVLEAAAASDGRLVPFCRLDPMRTPVSELERCLEAGARGVKLHPRAENFGLSHPMIDPIVAICHEHRLPLIVHAGRGIPALASDALDLARRHPDARIVLGHAGICDLNWIWRRIAETPNLFFDLSWWHPSDLLALFRLIPPGQLLFASDLPYFTPTFTATLAVRFARQAGLGDAQIAEILGGQARRILAGEDPLDLGPAPGVRSAPYSVLLERITGWLVTAVGRMILRDSGYEALALARLACDIGDESDPDADICRSVVRLLDLQEEFARDNPDGGGLAYPGVYMVALAACVARTPDVPVPEIPELRPVGRLRDASAAGHRAISLTELPVAQDVVTDLRRSSAADHLIVDPAPGRRSVSGIQQVPSRDGD